MIDLRALAPAVILVAAASSAVAEPPTRTISGELAYLQRIALSPESVAVVEFRNSDDQLEGETRFDSEGRQVPLPFALQVPRETDGEIRGAIWSGGRPARVSETVAITAGTGPLEIGTLLLQPFAPASFTTLMRCGATEIRIEFADDKARMRVDGETVDLRRVPAASGAKFAASDDPDSFHWSKGNQAIVSVGGKTLPECVAAVPVKKTPFRARGNEPGWNLKISGGLLQLSLDYGTREIEAKLPPPVSTDDVQEYQLTKHDLSIRISDYPCQDDMTGMPYPKTVVLELDDRRLTGCGGDPRSLLEGPEWTVRSLAGEPVSDEASVTIMFRKESRVAGSSGCNRFMGGYELTGEGISFGQIAGTMMACPEPQMQTEQRFLGLLQTVTRFEITPDGGLMLIATNGKRIRAER